MDRIIVYPGALPQDTDILNTNRNTMIALGYIAQALMGQGTVVDGLNCVPTTPASLQVSVGPGSIFALSTIDANPYGSLAADATDPLVKVGINAIGNTPFTISIPTTSGYSQNYLIEAALLETDTGATVLPYYNASNPSQPYSGPNNTGAAQNTDRTQTVELQLKAGAAAPTGTQVTPAVDTGYVGLWVITANYGQSTITASSIAKYLGAPFIYNKLPNVIGAFSASISSNTTLSVAQAGTVFDVSGSATVGLPGAASALNVMYGFFATTACTIDSLGGNIIGGVINATSVSMSANDFLYVRSNGSVWELLTASADLSGSPPNSPQWTAGAVSSVVGATISGGVMTIPSGQWTAGSVSAVHGGTISGGNLTITGSSTLPLSASNLTASTGVFNKMQVFLSSGTFTVPAGVTEARITVIGGGGGGGASASTTVGSAWSSAAGGGGAGTAIGVYSVSGSYTVTIGAGGAGGTTSNYPGNAGGTSSFGSLATATGGGGATWSSSTASPGGINGSATGGVINIAGGIGSDGMNGAQVGFGNGGASSMGGSGRAGVGGGIGGTAFGSGGGGAYLGNVGNGGAGVQGIVIVEW